MRRLCPRNVPLRRARVRTARLSMRPALRPRLELRMKIKTTPLKPKTAGSQPGRAPALRKDALHADNSTRERAPSALFVTKCPAVAEFILTISRRSAPVKRKPACRKLRVAPPPALASRRGGKNTNNRNLNAENPARHPGTRTPDGKAGGGKRNNPSYRVSKAFGKFCLTGIRMAAGPARPARHHHKPLTSLIVSRLWNTHG